MSWIKRLAITGVLLATIFMVVAQEYYNRQPRPDELRRVAGLSFYPQDGPHENVLPYVATNNQVFPITTYTNFVIFACLAPTNVFAVMPDCTQSVGQVFTVIAGARSTVILTNANVQTFSDTTNAPGSDGTPLSSWTMRTNTGVRIFSTGTNWFVYPTKS